MKKNGKKEKIIARDIDRIVDVYQEKYLLVKNKSIYLNDELIDEKVKPDSIQIKDNKIYYLQDHKT